MRIPDLWEVKKMALLHVLLSKGFIPSIYIMRYVSSWQKTKDSEIFGLKGCHRDQIRTFM